MELCMPEEARGRDTKKKPSLAVTSSTAGGGVGLPDDLVVEILSHVPVKSIYRFKCISPSWHSLISHPDNRKMLPQTVTGFFYFDEFDWCTFVSLAKPPSPCEFLPANARRGVVDCCNGLVLLNNSSVAGSGSGSEPCPLYVVSNPATEKWTAVPGYGSTHADDMICSASILCFDPAVSQHFHVVEFLDREPGPGEDDWYSEESLLEGFNIYSSETGAWVFHPYNSCRTPVAHRSRRTFFNGHLHLVTFDDGAVVALDMRGRTRGVFFSPLNSLNGKVQLIGHSQGRLFYVSRDALDASKLSIYVLGEGENGRPWTLKHCIDTSGLLFADAGEYLQSDLLVGVAAVHPRGDSIFLFDSSLQGRLMSFGMVSRRGHVIGSSVEESWFGSFVPYVPLYLEMAALENSN